ncbi:hypothetical protein JI750_12020 [Flavobacterium sp. GN10]|uniref:Chaperone of endosialidase n=1 Tax=Flavobacterium tagetis TaxID=2801336 RepID=A0ABS1KEH5_9FLAO|nr:hypothetical protein [Flavobacterium tagetis]MBL0737622.1 hypothetical protein [Flavobacterium tagetis]
MIIIKKITLLALLVVQSSFGQNPMNIGSLKISNDNIYNTWLDSGGVARMFMGFDGAKGYISFGAHTGGGHRDDILYMRGNDGNVGIGTSDPQARLHVNNGDNSYGIILANSSEAPFSLYAKSLTTQPINVEAFRLGMKYSDVEENGFISFYRGTSMRGGFLGFSTNGIERISISSTGKVGIGMLNPTNELDVNGTIHSKEVKVDMTGWTWPDFVFKKEYNLPTLEEVEKHITEKGHLKNIPSEEEVFKNGIDLGEMNAKLLQKIEELTLYIIEMKKENESLQRNQRNLEERMKKIETR